MEPLNIVLYLNDSPATGRALRYLAPLAATQAVRITLLSNEANAAKAAALFDQANAELGAARPPVRSTRTGGPERSLALEVAESKPDLIVMAPLRQRGWARWLRGPRANALAGRVTSSVLLMRGRPQQLQRALICTAGGEQVRADAALTARLLGPLKGHATILHVISQIPLLYASPHGSDQVLHAFFKSNPTVERHIRAAEASLKAAGVDVSVKLRVGAVVEEVIEEIREGGYDLLVIGAHLATSPLERLLLEDLSSDLLLASPVPILLVQGAGT